MSDTCYFPLPKKPLDNAIKCLNLLPKDIKTETVQLFFSHLDNILQPIQPKSLPKDQPLHSFFASEFKSFGSSLFYIPEIPLHHRLATYRFSQYLLTQFPNTNQEEQIINYTRALIKDQIAIQRDIEQDENLFEKIRQNLANVTETEKFRILSILSYSQGPVWDQYAAKIAHLACNVIEKSKHQKPSAFFLINTLPLLFPITHTTSIPTLIEDMKKALTYCQEGEIGKKTS